MEKIGDFILDNLGKLFLLAILILSIISFINYKQGEKWRVIQLLKGDDKGYYYVQEKHWLIFSWWWTHDDGHPENIKFNSQSHATYYIDKIREEERIQEEEDKLDDYKVIPYGSKEETKK